MADHVGAMARLESGGVLDRTGLTLPVGISYERYEALGRLLMEAADGIEWAQGDWLAGGEDLFPEEHSQAWEDAMGQLDEKTKMQRIRVSKAFPKPRRYSQLTWSHHRSVYSHPDEAQDYWLRQAVEHGWPRWRMDEAMREAREETSGPPAPTRAYVMERACEAAEVAYRAAQRDGDVYVVPALQFEAMAEALGIEIGTQVPA